MKANELMIGDWVLDKAVSDKPVQVEQINEQNVHYKRGNGYMSAGVKLLEPAPLTDEILIQNGFEKKGHRYGIYDDYFDFQMFEYNDGTWLVSYHCCEMSLPDEQVLLFHVHQLQHFMRHCGIDKDIIIKKED